MRGPSRRTAGSEDGFTLVEMLFATSMLLVVGFAALLLATTVQRSTDLAYGRQTASADARVALQRMAADVRQATAITVSSSTVMDLAIYDRSAPGTQQHVQWACSSVAQTCTRMRCASAYGSACTTTTTLYRIGGVTNTDVFTPRNGGTQLGLPASVSPTFTGSSSIDYVAVHLRVRVDRHDNGPQTTPLAQNATDFYDGADVATYEN